MASSGNVALQVQQLPNQRLQVFALSFLLGLRNSDLGFVPTEISDLFLRLRIPPPSNISQCLATLRRSKFLVHDSTTKRWYITPLGELGIRSLLTDLDWDSVERASEVAPNSLFAEVPHLTLPPAFAPPRWQPGINRLLDQYPFEQNVFCMTRFPIDNPPMRDPVDGVVEVLREVLLEHSLVLHMASDRQIDDDLLGNIGAYMWASRYGVGLLENRAEKGLNFNVVIELGSMLMTGRRCAMLKDCTAPNLPTDLSGQIYKSVDFDDLNQVAKEAHNWAAHDLGLGRCENCPGK